MYKYFYYDNPVMANQLAIIMVDKQRKKAPVMLLSLDLASI